MYLCYHIHTYMNNYGIRVAQIMYHQVHMTNDGELVWKMHCVSHPNMGTYYNGKYLTAIQAAKKLHLRQGVPRMDRPSAGKKVTEREAAILVGMAGYAALDWLRENEDLINSPELKNYQKPRKKRSSKK